MKRILIVGCLIGAILVLAGCSWITDILGDIGMMAQGSEKDEGEKVIESPYSKPDVLCTYFHYFRTDDFGQWWYPGKEPSTILGPEPWRRNVWMGRAGDYPYIGTYDNVHDGEIMRWHIRLAKAAGITAFVIYVFNWEEQFAETQLMFDVAAQEGFKIGLCEHHSHLGAVSRGIFDGNPSPILSRKYVGYNQIMVEYSQQFGYPLPPETTRYLNRALPRSLQRAREVPEEALQQASARIADMLNQWKMHPAYLRVDGKPIVVIPYADEQLEPGDFKQLADRIELGVGDDLYIVAIVPQVYWYFYPPHIPNSGITQEWANSGVDAFTHWTPNGMITAPQKQRYDVTYFNVQDSLKWAKDPMIPVMPGFDDDSWQPGDDPAPSSPRRNGEAWREQLDAAFRAKPRFLFVQAWNEWHEGSQIEPSTLYSDPYLYLKILAQKLDKPWQTPPLPPPNSVDPLRLPYLPY